MNAMNSTKGLHRRLLILTILGGALLTVAATNPSPAKAEVRVRARIQTPNLTVRVGNPAGRAGVQVTYDSRYDRQHNPRPIARPGLRVKRLPQTYRVELTKKDQRIAKQLARWTVYSKSEILELRRDGFRWFEIGRVLDINPRLVRAALETVPGWKGSHGPGHKNWHDNEHKFVRCGN